MKRIWLVALSGALATATMALAMDDASAARRASGVRAASHSAVPARGVYRRAAYRPGVVAPRVTIGGRHYEYWDRPAWGVGAAALAAGAAAATVTNAAYGTYGSYEAGSFDGGIYRRPYGIYPLGWRARMVARAVRPDAMATWSYYPTRGEYSAAYVSPAYYGPRCHPWFDAGCQ